MNSKLQLLWSYFNILPTQNKNVVTLDDTMPQNIAVLTTSVSPLIYSDFANG